MEETYLFKWRQMLLEFPEITEKQWLFLITLFVLSTHTQEHSYG